MTGSRSNPVVAENLRPGTLSWLPERLRFTPDVSYGEAVKERDLTYSPLGEYRRDDNAPHRDSGRCAIIEGWCSQPSVKAGDSLQVLPDAFAGIDLSPVVPPGACTAVARASQNRIVTTMRLTEVRADSTNALAIEAAVRRLDQAADEQLHLAASHRQLRGQNF